MSPVATRSALLSPLSSRQALLEVQGVCVTMESRDGAPLEVLRDISLSVQAGEFVSIIGPSGSGKSTLLNVVSGLLEPDSGTVSLKGDPAATRLGRVAYMHQRDLLMPWRDVLGNASLGLELNGIPRREARERARRSLATFGLEGFGEVYPEQLSGGMRQRVALLRSTLPDRELMLLDEPFGALDAITRAGLQRWLARLFESGRGHGMLLVTHDVEEALLLSDRVHVLTTLPGRVRAVVDVSLPRPRSTADTTDSEFVALKRRLLDALAVREGAWDGVP